MGSHPEEPRSSLFYFPFEHCAGVPDPRDFEGDYRFRTRDPGPGASVRGGGHATSRARAAIRAAGTLRAAGAPCLLRETRHDQPFRKSTADGLGGLAREGRWGGDPTCSSAAAVVGVRRVHAADLGGERDVPSRVLSIWLAVGRPLGHLMRDSHLWHATSILPGSAAWPPGRPALPFRPASRAAGGGGGFGACSGVMQQLFSAAR
jgi:hypothetical protein